METKPSFVERYGIKSIEILLLDFCGFSRLVDGVHTFIYRNEIDIERYKYFLDHMNKRVYAHDLCVLNSTLKGHILKIQVFLSPQRANVVYLL